jgi:hypothetical protein
MRCTQRWGVAVLMLALCNDLVVMTLTKNGGMLFFELHLLKGMRVLQPEVRSCKSFSRHLPSTMHLSYDICAFLLSA